MAELTVVKRHEIVWAEEEQEEQSGSSWIALLAEMFYSFLSFKEGPIEIPFNDYIQNPHILSSEENLPARVFEDLDRSYATYNGVNLIEEVWKRLKPTDHPSYFAAKEGLGQGSRWGDIHALVKKEFVTSYFPVFCDRVGKGMKPEIKRAFLASFCQASATALCTFRQMGEEEMPMRILEGKAAIIHLDGKARLEYQATLVQQVYVSTPGGMELQYGPKEETLSVTIDFMWEWGQMTLQAIKSPRAGQPIQ